MAPKRARSEDTSRSTKKKRPQFFRVLIPNPFAKLIIPRNFKRKYLDKEKQKRATLLSPLGKSWHVNLGQQGENLYFAKSGWYEFAKAHALRTGYFLIFRYEGNMVFTVKIFDETCCLKECDGFSTEFSQSEEECLTLSEHSDPEDEPYGKSSPRSKKRRKSVEMESPPSSPVETEIDTKSNNKNPFPQFEKVVRPLSSKYMGLPIKFCKKYNLMSQECLFFKNKKGKMGFPVKLLLRDREVRLGKGWKVFAKKSGFRDDDTCIFQLIARNTLLVQVKREIQKGSKKRRAKALNLRENKVAKFCPRFEKIIRPFNLSYGYLNIMMSFCLQNGLSSKCNIKLKDLNGKSWLVRFFIRKDKGKFKNGWRKFAKECNLEQGDKCIFELVQENTFLVRVEKKQIEMSQG